MAEYTLYLVFGKFDRAISERTLRPEGPSVNSNHEIRIEVEK
jgi:hypothetical protein